MSYITCNFSWITGKNYLTDNFAGKWSEKLISKLDISRYNTRPKQNSGYATTDFLDNFRDFADIKNDHIRRRSRY